MTAADIPWIATARLTLRPPRASDAAPLRALVDDYEVAKMLAVVPHPYPEGMAEDFVAGRLSEPGTMVFVLDDGAPCGVIGFDAGGDADRDADYTLGYWLGRRFWGKGYMREATRAAVDAVFARGASALASGAFEENAASQAILRRLGFREIGRGLKWSEARGARVPHIDMRLDRAGWEAQA